MKYLATAVASIVLSAGISVGITHSVMQEHNRQEVQGVTVDAFNDGFLTGACHNGEDGMGVSCN